MKNKRKLIFATMSMTIIFIIVIVLLIAGLIKTIANNNKPYYMKKSRVENVSYHLPNAILPFLLGSVSSLSENIPK